MFVILKLLVSKLCHYKIREGRGKDHFPSQLRAPKQSPLPHPLPGAAGTEPPLRVAKKLRSAMRENDQPKAGGRYFICKIVKSLKTNFLGRGLRWERGREEKSIFSCHSDTEVTLGRALPATHTHTYTPSFPSRVETVPASVSTDLSGNRRTQASCVHWHSSSRNANSLSDC